MPLYSFEYVDEHGNVVIFDEFYSNNFDFSKVKSPCGQFEAKRVFTPFAVKEGMTSLEKSKGTTKQRKEYGSFMKEQRKNRKKTYPPGTKEHDSNELWTGKEGKDGISNLPINKK